MSEPDATQVRVATPADLDVALELIDALIREDAGAHDPDANLDWAAEHGRERIGDVISSASRIALLAEHDAHLVGMLLGSLVDPEPFQPLTVARLGSLYVVPGHRSRGAGSALVRAFLTWADGHGAGAAQVTAYAVNSRAIAFYRRQGLLPYELVLRRRSVTAR